MTARPQKDDCQFCRFRSHPECQSILGGYRVTPEGFVRTIALIKIECPFCAQVAWSGTESGLKAFEAAHQEHCRNLPDRTAFREWDAKQKKAKAKEATQP